MFKDISPASFVDARDNGEPWQLLDVREAWETARAAVAGTICIPMMDVPSRLNELDPSQPVAVICHSGVRSGKVAEFLSQHGFSRVANIAGGIDAWSLEVDENVPRY